MNHKKIQWKEGMLLKPHHFQYQDLYHEENLHTHVIQHHHYYWGFNLLELDQEALNQSQLKIQKAEGYFPDGSYFNIPNLNLSPSSITLSDLASGTRIFLTSLNKTIKPNEAEYKSSFIHTQSKAHNCDGTEEDIIEISFKSKQLKLKSELDDMTNDNCLAITEIDLTSAIKINQNFLPVFINTQNNVYLNEKIELLLIKLKESIKFSSINFLPEGIGSVLQKIRLKQLKEALHRLNHIRNKRNSHPEEIYLYLISLKIQLDENNSSTLPEINYIHDDAAKTFNPLINDLFHLLKTDPYHNFIKIKFNNYNQSYWLSEAIDEELIDKEWILNIQLVSRINKFSSEEIIRQIKLATPKSIQLFLKQALPGIKLSTENAFSTLLDKAENQYLLRIHKNSYPHFQLENPKQLVLHAPLSLGQLTPELWIKKAC